MQKLDLSKRRVIVLAHVLTTVPAEDLKTFLLESNVLSMMYIGHPLYYKQGRPGSTSEEYQNGTLIRKRQLSNRKMNTLLSYVIHALLSLFWILCTKGKWDTMICLDNLNCFVGLLLRKFHKVHTVIYYSIDFTPQRFSNTYMNTFYHYIEKLCVKSADLTWNISPRIAEGREKLLNMPKAIYTKQITVPVGVWTAQIPHLKHEAIQPHRMVYAGSLSPHQGIQLALEAMPAIVKKVPDLKFKIIGIGEYEQTLKELANKLDISQYVDFLGYFEKHEDVDKELITCGVSVAMYNEELSKWSYYADPSKIKSYLACGLPVITTSLTYIAPILEEKKCGIVIPYNKEDLAQAIIRLLTDSKLHKMYRNNAIQYSKEFDWNEIFTDGLQRLPILRKE